MDYLEYKSFELLDDTVTLKNDAETFQMLLDLGWEDVSVPNLKRLNRACQIDSLYPLYEYEKGSCKRFFKSNGCELYFDYETCLNIRIPRLGGVTHKGSLFNGVKVPKLMLEAYPNYSYIKGSKLYDWFQK